MLNLPFLKSHNIAKHDRFPCSLCRRHLFFYIIIILHEAKCIWEFLL